MHPWVPVEPWEPGDLGIPVCDGPERQPSIALIICHDGMFPEMARECAYKGAEIMIRTAGYTAPIRHTWHFTNQANAFCNLMYTASVCMCGSRRLVRFDGRRHDRELRRHALAPAHGRPTRSSPPRCGPDLVREARTHWGVENNIYQFGHRGYVAVKGGARDCPYTFMHDLVAGKYRLPWEKSGQGDRWHELRLCPAHARLPSRALDPAGEGSQAGRGIGTLRLQSAPQSASRDLASP